MLNVISEAQVASLEYKTQWNGYMIDTLHTLNFTSTFSLIFQEEKTIIYHFWWPKDF